MDLEQFDIVHIHEANETIGDALAHGIRRGYLSKSQRAKICLGLYNPEVHRLPRSMQEIVWQFVSRNADGIISLSHYSKENILKAYRVPKDRIVVSYPGVNEGFFRVKRKDSERERATLLFCGRINGLHDQKGIDVLIESLPMITRKHDIILRIVGGGTHVAAFERIVKQRGIESSVEFIGFVEHSNLPGIFAGADVFVLPSRRESFGLVIAEAMAVGLPVVSTDVGAIPEVVIDSETGILVSPDSPSELASAVDVLLSNRTKLNEFGLNGRNRATAHFTWEEAAKRIEGFYKEIIT
jgi:glycosyltransferase involved in cell wall biosynthesis